MYITVAYSPFPDILTSKCVFMRFLSTHYCMEEVCFPNIILLRLHVKIWFDLIASDFSIDKLKKQSLTYRTILNFEFLLGKTSGAIKPVQVNSMMITSSMCPYSIVSNKVSTAFQTKNFNSCCKEEQHKGNIDCRMFWVHIFPWTQTHQSPVWCSNTT